MAEQVPVGDDGTITITDEMESASVWVYLLPPPYHSADGNVQTLYGSLAVISPLCGFRQHVIQVSCVISSWRHARHRVARFLRPVSMPIIHAWMSNGANMLILLTRCVHSQMRIKQPGAAKSIVMYSTMVWAQFHNWATAYASSPNAPVAQREQLRRLLGKLPMGPATKWVFPIHHQYGGLTCCDTNYTDSCVHGRAHFAIAIVVNPWACLGEGIKPSTSIIYLDSMRSDTPLATSKLFAQAIVEWDAI